MTKKEIQSAYESDNLGMYHCEECEVHFVAVRGFHFCLRCGLMAIFEVDESLPF